MQTFRRFSGKNRVFISFFSVYRFDSEIAFVFERSVLSTLSAADLLFNRVVANQLTVTVR
jgi:hypothetical protein